MGKSIAALGTLWVYVGTPDLTGGGASGGRSPGEHASQSGGIETILGYATWIGLGIAVLSLMAIGVRLATLRREDGAIHIDRMITVLGGVVIISAATGVVAKVLPTVQANASPAVAYLQNSLFWYMAAATILSVIIGGARMAWQQRAEPGRDLVKSLLTLIVISGAGVTVISLLVAASDAFSIWILNGALDCDVAAKGGTCFGGNMTALMALTAKTPNSGLGAILILILGLGAVLASLIQILLMLARSGMLVILAGILPTAAAATNTELGRSWFTRATGWTLAFVLYKPAAAIVYAAAFKLSGTSVFRDDGTGLTSVLVGIVTLCLAVIALPALMRFAVPMVAVLSGGGGSGGAMALGAAASLPTGAVQTAGRMSTSQASSGSAPPASSSGPDSAPTGSGPSAGPSGGSHPGRSGEPGGPGAGGGSGQPGGQGTPGLHGSGAVVPSGGAVGPGNAGAGAPAGSPGAAGAAGGSGSAGGAAGGAGAAAGPVGAAVATGAQAVGTTIGVARDAAARSTGSESNGSDGGGPSGSR